LLPWTLTWLKNQSCHSLLCILSVPFCCFFPLFQLSPSMGKTHNSKYYFKLLSKKRVQSLQKIGDVFRKINKGTTNLCVIQSEVRKVMNELLTSACNETKYWQPWHQFVKSRGVFFYSQDCHSLWSNQHCSCNYKTGWSEKVLITEVWTEA
jgi:hypothetical protein